MHESFRNAVNPGPRFSCLRIPLKPLTLGHRWLLTELESPLIIGGPCGFGDILTAVIVCAQSHTDARKDLARNWWLEIFARYWGWRCSGMDLSQEVAKFQTYLEFEQNRPPTSPPDKAQSRSLGAPWDWIILDMLLSVHGLTKDQALTIPLREANALWASHWDSEGRIQLATATGSVEGIIRGIWERRRSGSEKN